VITDGKKLAFEKHVADLEALREYFKLEKLTLYGNSWGGLLASLYAIAHPDRVERMILGNPAPPMRGFLNDQDDEIGRRLKIMYKPEQLERLKIAEKSETWLKASDPHAICREFFLPVLHCLHVFAHVGWLQGRSVCRAERIRASVARGKCRHVEQPRRF
jgi:pimeloyl-ACP methyl ester carboxylesterase